MIDARSGSATTYLTRIDDAVVRDAGLSIKQAQQFFALDENELQRNLAWLERPENHLLTADDPRYPLLRTI
ncbi:hypothetical protein KIF59_22885 [Enterobacter cloacae subsp. cloacae]|nr:hypothetical protein [Enterobacter cloacae subsp. cloacae]